MSSGAPDRRPSVAYVSYSSGEFDARSLRMARSAAAEGWRATIYARLEPGHPDVEELDGVRLIRVPADWRRAVPGLRWWARRRGRAELRAAARLRRPEPAAALETGAGSDLDEEGMGRPERNGAADAAGVPRRETAFPAGPRRSVVDVLPRPVQRWGRTLVAFPIRPMGWAAALDDHVEPADIWHGMWIGSLPAIVRQRRRLGGRSVYDSRDVYLLARDRQTLERPVRALIAWLERRLARRVDRVITVNEPYADLLTDQLGVDRPAVVMNCPDLVPDGAPTRDRIREALGLDASTAVVLYQGQLITDRGIEQAMDAILEVPGAVLVLLGYGPMAAGLRAATAAPPYLGRVHLLPAVPPDDLLAWTASADLTVVPIQPTTVNHRFSTPQKLFESLAAGVPVVAADLPGMADIVRPSGVGVLCDPTSPTALAAAIREVLDAPPEERAALRARVRTAAREHYNWSAQADVLFGIYEGLVHGAIGHGAATPDRGSRSGELAGRPAPSARSTSLRRIRAIDWRAVARRLGLGRVRRAVRVVAAEGSLEAIRHPRRSLRRAAFVIAGAHARLREEAHLADRHGEPTRARELWLRLAADGDVDARRRARRDEGVLRETDPAWLPTGGVEAEALGPLVPRRILHLVKSSVPERWSGYTIRTHNNVRAQLAAGLEPIVVTEIGWPRIAGVTHFDARFEVDGVRHIRLDRGPAYDPRALPDDAQLDDLTAELVPLVRELRPSLIQAHSGHRGGELALVALALRERLGIPVAYEVRGLFESVWSVDDIDVEHAELFARRLGQETRILHQVDGVLAISEALIDALAARGIPRDRMFLLPNGIDPAAFARRKRDAALRRRLGLGGRFVVGYVGNLDHRREGIDVLIRALVELRRRGCTDVAALVVGDGETRGALEALAARAEVSSDCHFTGRVPHDQVAGYYAQIDLFVNPRIDEWASRYITPLKPFEAMALGLPVLVSDLPALREIVDPPNRGLTAPPGDPVGLADAIIRLRDDAALRERVAVAGYDWVRSERTWAANGARYLAAYAAIAGASA